MTEAFTPDFYLPDQDVYVETTVMRQDLVRRKNRKARMVRKRYGVVVTVLYRRDFERLSADHGLERLGAAARRRSWER